MDRPAGSQVSSLNSADRSLGQKHLNGSRRRILNDFVTMRPDANLQTLANRNAND